MFKGFGNFANLMRQAQALGGRMQEIGEEMKSREVSAAAGGGLVEVVANGNLELVRLKVDDSLLANPDREFVEDLILSAANQALAKARALHADAMRELTGGIDLPGVKELLAKLGGSVDEGGLP